MAITSASSRSVDHSRSGSSELLAADLASLRLAPQQRTRPTGARTSRWVVSASLLAVVLATTLWAEWGHLGRSRTAVAHEPVTTARPVAVAAPVVAPHAAPAPTVTASGYVVAERISRVGAQVVARVEEVLVSEGDRVKKGQLLARLDLRAEEASRRSTHAREQAARARAAAARAAVDELTQTLDRQRTLAANGAATHATVEDLTLRVRTAEQNARAAAADAQVAAAELQRSTAELNNREILAPLDGIVVNRPLAAGEVVGLPGSEPIVELADFDQLIVEAEVPESRVAVLTRGTPGEITLDAFPGRRFHGEVVGFGARVNRAKATVAVKLRFLDGIDGVLPDMAAQTTFSPHP